jgi:hypothetical protein
VTFISGEIQKIKGKKTHSHTLEELRSGICCSISEIFREEFQGVSAIFFMGIPCAFG